MDYIRTDENGQLVLEQSTEFLHIPCCLFGFHNTETIVGKAASGRTVYCCQGNWICRKASGVASVVSGCM